MVKTVSHDEVKQMQKIMKNYYEFLKENPNSFLCRILGMYRVEMYHLKRTIYFIVMASAYKGAAGPMDVQYDCKGSHVGRNADPGDSVKKDNDLLEDGFRLCLGSNREAVVSQLRLDAHFLRSLGFLDYSLLVGARWVGMRRSGSVKAAPPPAAAAEAQEAEGAGAAGSGGNGEEDESEQDNRRKTNGGPFRFGFGGGGGKSAARASMIDQAAVDEMSQSLHGRMQSVNLGPGGASPGGAGAGGGGGDGESVNILEIADSIYVAKRKDTPGRRPSMAELATGLSPADLARITHHGDVESDHEDDEDASAPAAPAPPPQRPVLTRRASERSIQLAYAKKWERSMTKSSSAMKLEVELADEVRERMLRDSEFSVNAAGGLPACPPPMDAAWAVPPPRSSAFEAAVGGQSQRLRKSSETKDADGRRSVEFNVVSPLRGVPVRKSDERKVADDEDEAENAGPVAKEYRLGVIDFLTTYSLAKIGERTFKSFKYEKKALSVAPPDVYCERFIAFVEGISVGSAPPAELPGGGYLVQVVLKQAGVAGIDLANNSAAGSGAEAAWNGSGMGIVKAAQEEEAEKASPLEALYAKLKKGSISSMTAAGGSGGSGGSGDAPGLRMFSSAGTNDPRHGVKSGNVKAMSSSLPKSGGCKDTAGVVCMSIREGCEGSVAGIRAGDRIHRINGDLVPASLSAAMVTERMKRASRPLYLTLERWPSKADKQRKQRLTTAAAASLKARDDAAAAKAARQAELDGLRAPLPEKLVLPPLSLPPPPAPTLLPPPPVDTAAELPAPPLPPAKLPKSPEELPTPPPAELPAPPPAELPVASKVADLIRAPRWSAPPG